MTRFCGMAEDFSKKIQKKSDNHLAKNAIVCYCKNCTEMGSLRKAG